MLGSRSGVNIPGGRLGVNEDGTSKSQPVAKSPRKAEATHAYLLAVADDTAEQVHKRALDCIPPHTPVPRARIRPPGPRPRRFRRRTNAHRGSRLPWATSFSGTPPPPPTLRSASGAYTTSGPLPSCSITRCHWCSPTPPRRAVYGVLPHGD